ncbi:MAG: helix-turn-helix transcriptional regulator [Gammaproteobacteria bacterium]|nr:helix-turn-helix transcriptional regulator [Gammaproteobacteria bacterium]
MATKKTRGRPPASRPNAKAGGLNRAEELLAAALELFATRNFADVTIKDIAAATGVNTALIHYYFDSMAVIEQKLFRAVDADRNAMFVSTLLDGVMVRSVIVPDFRVDKAIAVLRRQLWALLGYKGARAIT